LQLIVCTYSPRQARVFFYQKTQKNHKNEYNPWYFADTSSKSASKKQAKGNKSSEINQLPLTDVRDQRKKLSSTLPKAA